MLARTATIVSLFVLFLLGTVLPVAAQIPTDTVGLDEEPKALLIADEFEQISIPDRILPEPRKAAFLSAILPGMGQIYNGSLWKVPLVYAGGVVVVYTVNFYNQRYSESLKNLRTIRFNPDIDTIDERDQAFYERSSDFYRRQRDYTIILGAAFYGLQIVEAYVDAQLQSFDLDDDLSVRVRPSLLPDPSGTMAAGVRITYTFP